MPESSKTSFIPKHTTNKIERKNTPRRVFIGTIIVRILFFVVLIVAVGTYAYDSKVKRDFNDVRTDLGSSVPSVEDNSLERLIDFDSGLKIANEIWQQSTSMVSLLELLGSRTVANVQIKNLSVSREPDETFSLAAEILTNSYDTVANQRRAFTEDDRITINSLSDVSIQPPPEIRPQDGSLSVTTVTAQVELMIPLSAVPFIPTNFTAVPANPSNDLAQAVLINQPEL
jgi:hypothetical protein